MAARVVIDTNVLVSGIIVAHGPSAQILASVQRGELTLITCAALLEEFSDVILRPRIARKYPRVAEHADALLDYLRANAVLVSGIPTAAIVPADPDDDCVIACALEGKADYLVSGDPHLLDLRSHGDIPILGPRDFVEAVLGSH